MTYRLTSLRALKEIAPKLGARQQEVLDELNRFPDQTNTELSRRLMREINTITPRVLELRKLSRVMKSGERRCKITGRIAITWAPIAKAEQLSLLA